jgi:hypothetical protein
MVVSFFPTAGFGKMVGPGIVSVTRINLQGKIDSFDSKPFKKKSVIETSRDPIPYKYRPFSKIPYEGRAVNTRVRHRGLHF